MSSVLLPLALALTSAPADACGGFFCNQDSPVVQSAERVVFAVDSGAGVVTTEVGISYSGPSSEFAWIVPTPSVPDLFVTADSLFTTLNLATQPYYSLDYESDGDCWYPPSTVVVTTLTAVEDAGGYGVQVVAESQVGPYDTVTLQADSSSALLDWLQDAGFDLPDDLNPKLAPYVAQGQYFVALKLHKGQSVGDIAPIGMTYAGTEASIPIQLTALAAQPGMRLEVYMFGEQRAVPTSYLHVIPNDLAVDWFGGTVSYDDVVSLAADEAGGHAFATDFSGDTAPLRGSLYQEGRYDLTPMYAATNAVEWMDQIIGQGFAPSLQLQDVLRAYIPLPPELAATGVAETDWWNCLECYSEYSLALPFDATAATDGLDAAVIEPLRLAEDLVDRFPHLTRLTSSLDAVEMTVDPIFAFNADMEQEYTSQHVARVVYHCGSGLDIGKAARTATFPQGYVVELPSRVWLLDHGMTEYEYMQSLEGINAVVVEETSTSGDPVTIYDGYDDLQGLVDDLNGSTADIPTVPAEGGTARGCDSTGSSPVGLGLAALVALSARRRRS